MKHLHFDCNYIVLRKGRNKTPFLCEALKEAVVIDFDAAQKLLKEK